MAERLQKFLAKSGIGSRRYCEELIKSKKIKINIFKKYKLESVIQAHKDLESRKILGPAVIIPWIEYPCRIGEVSKL